MDTTHLDALDPETIDELLSAELDGELDAALVDLAPSVSATVFRNWLEATPSVQSRMQALRSAADLLRSDALAPTASDEIARRRLVSAAVTEVNGTDEITATHRRHPSNVRSRRAYLAIGSVAAGALLVAGVATSINSNDATQPSAAKQASVAANVPEVSPGFESSGAEAGAATAQRVAGLPDLGVISRISDIPDVGAPRATATTNAPRSGASSTRPQPDALDRATADTASARCLITLPSASVARDIANVAVATVNGVPAVVARGTSPRGTLTWVYRPADCVVLLTDAP